MFVLVDITGKPYDTERLEAFGRSIQDMTDPLTRIANLILAGIGKQFETEGGFGGEPWKDLTENYKAWKEHVVPGLPILVGVHAVGDKGNRHKYVTGKRYEPGGKLRDELVGVKTVDITPTRMVYLAPDGIAGFHQVGTKKMVARPPVPLSEFMSWQSVFSEWLDEKIAEFNS